MDMKKIGGRITALRRERGFTQEALADIIGVSPQAVSKWENARALPETALLPKLANALTTRIDALLADSKIQVLSAVYGDGIESFDVADRLNGLVYNDRLDITAGAASLACPADFNRPKYLIVKFETEQGVYYTCAGDNERMIIDRTSAGLTITDTVTIVAGAYGTAKKHTDVMEKIEHYKTFNWNEYRADHELFPSDPANDDTEYLTLVYMNRDGIHMATCGEGDSIAYTADRSGLYRKPASGACFMPGVPALPEFGMGMECSWAAALTAALNGMGAETDYAHVMGVSGACYRLAFCSPGWDYSSVDGLVAYDYATPGFKAFGYSEERYGRVEKADRAYHRERIAKDIRGNMPVLGINLRVAAEWGVICGYRENGETLYCRTKYDGQDVMQDGAPDDETKAARDETAPGNNTPVPFGYTQVDNWPFLISYFAGKSEPPSDAENFINSLKIFVDCSAKEKTGGYYTGFTAYDVWRNDLLDDEWYENSGDEQFARRFSVGQFCTLALCDARKTAYAYINANISVIPEKKDVVARIAGLFKQISEKCETMHNMLDSGEYLEGARARGFWTRDMRHRQAAILLDVKSAEQTAARIAGDI